MFGLLKSRRQTRNRELAIAAFLQKSWPVLDELSRDEKDLLARHMSGFLASHHFTGIDMTVTEEQQHYIAAHACLPVLHLGLDPLRDWKTVLIYPDTFLAESDWVDDIGVHHHARSAHAGEAWKRGPVILSWRDVAHDVGVIFHEVAHVLDGGNGSLNGFPVLPPGMSPEHWTRAFSDAFAHLQSALDQGREPPIDPYAATDPAEFFAVACEYFFLEPGHLRQQFPAVYEQLCGYFRQTPHLRRQADLHFY